MSTLKKTKQKMFLYSVLLILILFMLGYIFLNHEFDKLVQERVKSISKVSDNLYELSKSRYSTILKYSLEKLLLNEHFSKAIANKDIKKISEITKNLNVQILYKHSEIKNTLTGFKNVDSNIYYSLYRSVYYKDAYVGVVEISMPIDSYLNKLSQIYNIKSYKFAEHEVAGLEKSSKQYIYSSSIKLKDKDLNQLGYLVVYYDISDLIKPQDKLKNILLMVGLLISILILVFTEKGFESVLKHFRDQTFTDSLTSLGNKQKLDYDFSKNKINVLILMNIKQFSLINQLYGIKAGNEVLIEVSKNLEKFVQKYSMKVYRISSDEFAFLNFDDSFLEDKYLDIIEELHKEVNSIKIKVGEFLDVLEIEVNFGISYGNSDDNLVEKSQMALKKAKEKSLPFMAYTEYIDTKKSSSTIIKMKKTLKNALKNNNIVPFFQEIRDKDEKIVKYEALVRLIDYTDGKEKILYPGDFLAIAMNGGLYSAVAKEVLKQALEYFADKKEMISINFLPNDFFQPKVIDTFIEIVEEFDEPHRIVIEITEEESIEDFNRLIKIVKRFRKIGVKIAIDDFGSGYANYSHILKLKPDYLKIDGSLIKNILIDNESNVLVKSIVHFAQDLGIKTIAEFVEDKEIFEVLKEYGVDEYQGFYFGKAKDLINS